MAIVVGRNQTSIYGSVDGVKFPNVPVDGELYTQLKDIAKDVNQYEKSDRALYKKGIAGFKEVLAGKQTEAQVEVAEKKEVVVGTTNFKVELVDDKPYLINKAGVKSRFYIPDNLYKRIVDGQNKKIDVTPNFKFFIRALRGEVMTQDKLNRLDMYISRKWLNQELYRELLAKGYSEERAKEEATFVQVPITNEGFIRTYKVSTIITENDLSVTEYIEVEAGEETVETDEPVVVESAKKAAFEEFVFKPVRNSKGHFLARGSEEYMAAYNSQLREYNEKHGHTAPATVSIKEKKTGKVTKQVAREKAAENYVFQPYYQGQGGDAFYCGDKLGHEIRVGHVHRLPSWDMVDTNDNSSALPGLHVGGLEYIHDSTYYDGDKWKKNALTHNILVDPQFIGAVARHDDAYGALRVKEYYVESTFVAPNKGLYDSSSYGKLVDADWDLKIKEAEDIVRKAQEAQQFLNSTFQA